MPELIIVAHTPQARETARRLRSQLAYGSLVEVNSVAEARAAVARYVRQQRRLACVLPLDEVVQALAPLVAEGVEPLAIVVLDDAGHYTVALYGSEAARVCREVAGALGAAPVIVSAGDHWRPLAVELIGKRFGWKMEGEHNLERVLTAIRRGEPVAVYQDAGRRDWWQAFGPWPHHFERIADWPTEGCWSALIVISDRHLPPVPQTLADRWLAFRPQSLTLGVTCKRGIGSQELEQCVHRLFRKHGLSTLSLTAVASCVWLREEASLHYLADRYEIPLLTYSADKLRIVQPTLFEGDCATRLPPLSRLCEPAAMLAAGVRELVVPRTRFRHLALAVARRPHA